MTVDDELIGTAIAIDNVLDRCPTLAIVGRLNLVFTGIRCFPVKVNPGDLMRLAQINLQPGGIAVNTGPTCTAATVKGILRRVGIPFGGRGSCRASLGYQLRFRRHVGFCSIHFELPQRDAPTGSALHALNTDVATSCAQLNNVLATIAVRDRLDRLPVVSVRRHLNIVGFGVRHFPAKNQGGEIIGRTKIHGDPLIFAVLTGPTRIHVAVDRLFGQPAAVLGGRSEHRLV